MDYLKKYAPCLWKRTSKKPSNLQTSHLRPYTYEIWEMNRKYKKGYCCDLFRGEKNRSQTQVLGALLAAKKRKTELFNEIITSKPIYRSYLHSMSVSCLCSQHLSRCLPLVLPMFYFAPAVIRERLIHFSILTHKSFLTTSYPSFPCRKIRESPDNSKSCWQYDTVLNSAYLFATSGSGELFGMH